MEQDASAITCNIRGCPNEFGLSDPSHLLYVCTADDIQCKAWLAVIPKVSLRDVGERLCVCSLHFADGVNVSGDIVPTIFPPVPVSVPAATVSAPTPPPVSSKSLVGELTLVGPAVKIKEEPVDDYEQVAQVSPKMEDSEHFDSSGELELAADGIEEPRRLSRRRKLIKQLGGNMHLKQKNRRRRASSQCHERLDGKPHFIYKNPNANTKDCAVCSDRKKKGGRRETVFYCETCSLHPGLHPGDCFKHYHTVLKYR